MSEKSEEMTIKRIKREINDSYILASVLPTLFRTKLVKEHKEDFQQVVIRIPAERKWFSSNGHYLNLNDVGRRIAIGETHYFLDCLSELIPKGNNKLNPTKFKSYIQTIQKIDKCIVFVPIKFKFDVMIKNKEWGVFYDYSLNSFITKITSVDAQIITIPGGKLQDRVIIIGASMAEYLYKSPSSDSSERLHIKIQPLKGNSTLMDIYVNVLLYFQFDIEKIKKHAVLVNL